MRTLSVIPAALAAAVSLAACSSGAASTATAATAVHSARPAASSAAAKAAAKKRQHAIDACYKRRPASGDIYVRTAAPGTAATAQQLGGGWTWDYTAGQCLSSVALTIETAATGPGDCTTVGFVSDNPGYDANATPARRLESITAQAGPGC